MSQTIEKKVWEEFETALDLEQQQQQIKNTITNSARPTTPWMKKVTDKVRISDLAVEFGVDCCPNCQYPIDFDDARGWFICIKAKYDHKCDFKGNIVDFVERCGNG